MVLSNEETKEFEAAVMELTALGLIEFKDDEHFRINDKGIEKAKLRDRILVMMAVSETMDDSPLEKEDEV